MPIKDSQSHGVRLLFLLCIVYAGMAFYCSYPYRPFPTDELWGYDSALNFNWWQSGSPMLLNAPAHPASLYLVGQLVMSLNLDWLQTYLAMTVLSLAGAAAFLGLAVHTITRDALYTVATAILFLFSAWSQTYLHFYTYAPLSACFMAAALYCFTKYYVEDHQSRWYPLGSGFLIALFFTSSSSAKLLAGILFCAFFLLIFRSVVKEKKVHLALFTAGTTIPLIALMPLYLKPLYQHVTENISSCHGIDFFKKYGYEPTIPFFSYFHLLKVYSPVMFVFLLCSMVLIMLKWQALKRTRVGMLVLILLGAVISHSLILDLLPVTKLGRTQFPLIGLSIVALGLFYATFPWGAKRGKKLFLVAIIAAVLSDGYTSIQTWRSRRELPAKIASLPSRTVYFVIDEDPHGIYLQDWLGYGKKIGIYNLRLAELQAAMQTIPRSIPVAILVGPTGSWSGRSILSSGLLDDFHFALPPAIAAPTTYEAIRLPYYAFYPPFLMEEENCQCFYFRDQMLKETSGRDSITMYYWPAGY